jgi:hypothetical protein
MWTLSEVLDKALHDACWLRMELDTRQYCECNEPKAPRTRHLHVQSTSRHWTPLILESASPVQHRQISGDVSLGILHMLGIDWLQPVCRGGPTCIRPHAPKASSLARVFSSTTSSNERDIDEYRLHSPAITDVRSTNSSNSYARHDEPTQ